MATDNNIESVLSTSDTFCELPKISYSSPVEDITRALIEYGESGVPCVITGLPAGEDDERSPFCQSAGWVESIYTTRTRGAHNATGLTLPCPPEWATWLQDSFIVPGCLIPHGGDDILPDGTESASLGLFGPELPAIFQDHSSSTFTHDLLCVGDAGASKHWFITAAEDWLEVTEYLRERDGSRTVRAYSMSPHELSRVPFDMYAHTQKKGELVVLPPRSYCQTIHQGITASLRWERMTLRALETFIYHDMIFKQRTCVKIRYRPHRILCDTVTKLCDELTDLKRSQPNESVLLSAKSGTLKKGLRLLDEVVNYSRCPQDDLFPLMEPTTASSSCSFCGGELFQTAFCCTNSCICDNDDEPSGSAADFKILVCNLCFVDGRACRCGVMKPYRLQPLDELTELRRSIADLLDLGDEDGCSQLNQGSEGFSVFSSAKALCEIKSTSAQAERKCTPRVARSHGARTSSVVVCRGCHASRCYEHILSTFQIHSAQAIQAYITDTTSARWHALHREMKPLYTSNFPELRVAIRDGSEYALSYRLIYYASNFASTTPLNQAVTPGFYDAPGMEIATAPLRRSESRRGSVASVAGTSAGGRQQLCRRGSSVQSSSTVGEGSVSQRRGQGPLDQGDIRTKRARTAETDRKQARETIRKKKRVSRLSRRAVKYEEPQQEPEDPSDEPLPSDVSTETETEEDGSTTTHRGPSVRENRRSSRKPHQSSSPLHRPLAFFDPDTDLEVEKSNSSKSAYNSALDELLGIHTPSVPQPDADREFAAGPVIQESAPITLFHSTFPSSTSLQQQNRTNKQPPSYELLQFHEAEPPTQLESNRIHAPQRGFTEGVNLHSVPPAQHLKPGTSYSRLRMDGRNSTMNSMTPALSSQVSNWTSYPVYTTPPNDYVPLQPPTRYQSDIRGGFFRPTQPSTQTPVQSNEVPTKPRKSIIGNSLSLENLNAYAEILLESEKEWNATDKRVFRGDGP